MDFVTFVTAAIIVEGLVEYLATKWLSGDALKYTSLIVGVLFCFGFRLDLLTTLGLPPVASWIGYLATGLIIGRGGNYVNDIVSRIQGKNKLAV